MTAADWPTIGAEIADRWEHGHDQLTDECALCNAEFAEALAVARSLTPRLGGQQ